MAITWADLDTTLQDLIDKKLDKLTIDKDDPNKNKIYATNENGTTIGINYGSATDIGNRIVQVDENGNILVPDIVDENGNILISDGRVASNKGYVSSKVGVLNTTIEESMPQITFVNNVLTITTKQQNKEG